MFACSDKTCPAGTISVSNGDSNKTDNCQLCNVGTYSTGGNLTACLNSACINGDLPNKLGAINATDGCISTCPTGTV